MKRKGLSQQSVVSIAKNEYPSAVYFLERLIKSLNLISDEWLNGISKALVCLEFSQWNTVLNIFSSIFFGTAK